MLMLSTVSLSKMDISVQLVDQPFSVTVSIQKDQNNNVTIDIPSITQYFASSRDSPNFDPSKPFPSLWEPPDFGALPDTSIRMPHCLLTIHLAGISTRLTTISR